MKTPFKTFKSKSIFTLMTGFYLSFAVMSCTSDGISISDSTNEKGYEHMTADEIITTMSDSFELDGLKLVTPEEYNSYPKIDMEEVKSLGDGGLETRSSFLQLPTVPVSNQGTEGSCVAFAAGYLGSTYVIKNNKNYLVEPRSPEYLYNSTKIPGNCGAGTYMRNALDFLLDKGICGWSRMPYSDQNGCSIKPNAQQLAYGLYGRLTSWRTFVKSTENIKIVLNSKLPVLVGMSLHQSFFDQTFKSPFIYKSVSGNRVNGHAFNIVGYDDGKKVFICQNSWGTSSHDKGFFYIAYGLIANLDMELYILHPYVNLSGRWSAKGYTCDNKIIQEEIIEIDHKAMAVYSTDAITSFTAKKITGDPCVPAGKITFRGDFKNRGVNEDIIITRGTPSNPASTTFNGKLNFKDGIITITSGSIPKVTLYPIQ
jgi:C1A family cysteine protease